MNYAEACNEWRAHLHVLAPEQHSFEEILQRHQAVGDTVSDSVILPGRSRTPDLWQKPAMCTELTGRHISEWFYSSGSQTGDRSPLGVREAVSVGLQRGREFWINHPFELCSIGHLRT